jgi:hypothetical protein
MSTIDRINDASKTTAIEGGYRSPELQQAGTATKLVQGWAFSGYDCGYSTFYYSGYCG